MAPANGKQSLEGWCTQRVAVLLKMPASEVGDIVENILLFDAVTELHEFLSAFAEESSMQKEVQAFCDELFARKSGKAPPAATEVPKVKALPPTAEAESKGGAKGDSKGSSKGKDKGSSKGGSKGGSKSESKGKSKGSEGYADSSQVPVKGFSRLSSWAIQRLAGLLQLPIDDCTEILQNIMEYDDQEELNDFLGDFAEESSKGKVEAFVKELFERRKEEQEEQRSKTEQKVQEGKARANAKTASFPKLQQSGFKPVQQVIQDAGKENRLMVIDAASSRHAILTNCLNCGKVIAEDEGWGPCLFCGNPLSKVSNGTKVDGDQRGMLESVKENSVEDNKYNDSFERAVAQKNRQVEYDRNAQKRTKVYDDASDWFTEAANPWLSGKQREEAAKKGVQEEDKRAEDKRRVHVKLDLAKGTVVSDDTQYMEEQADKDRAGFDDWKEATMSKQKLLTVEDGVKAGSNNNLSGESQKLYDQLRASLHGASRKKGGAFGKQSEDSKKQGRWDASGDRNRVEGEFAFVDVSDFAGADVEYMEAEVSPYTDESDAGTCLSMHQPWASLLIHGFKRAEGRSWSHPHRGRLWIHAAGRPPEDEEIKEMEQYYTDLYESRGIPIPDLPSKVRGYPTSVLLGCVDAEEQWPKAEYEDFMKSNPGLPQEHNGGDHIFWCVRPRRLVVPVKMSGSNKIWQIDKYQLKAVQQALQPVRWPKPGGTAGSANGLFGDSGHLDLWPSTKQAERLEIVDRGSAVDRDIVVLQDGLVHLVGFVPPDIQQRIVDEMREIGLSEQGWFNEQVGAKLKRFNLGKHWNTVSQRWENVRGNINGAPVAPIASFLQEMYSEVVARANRELSDSKYKKRKITPLPTGPKPNIGVANFYTPSGHLNMHQDKYESRESIHKGYAVVGICVGDACEFSYSNEPPGASQKPKVVRLESGDVIVFGGASRLLWHGVQKVIPNTTPPSINIIPGRLNVTLRVF